MFICAGNYHDQEVKLTLPSGDQLIWTFIVRIEAADLLYKKTLTLITSWRMEGEQIVDEINNLLSERGCSIVSFNLHLPFIW